MEKDLVSLFNATTSDGTVSATGDQPDYTTGTPWLDCDLVGNVTESTRVSLKDHFALAINFYGIKEGDGMFLAPEDRVAIW